MPNVYLSPVFNEQTLDDNGELATGFLLYTYEAGTTTPRATYTAQDGISTHQNPIQLNARGEPPFPIWILAGETKFVLKTAASVDVRTVDDVAGVGTFGGGTVDVNGADIVNVDQIVGGTATAVTVGAFVPRWQNNGTSDATASNGVGRFSGDATGPTFSAWKSRNAAIGSHTIVQSGDELFALYALGSNGTTFDQAGYLKFLSGGTPGGSADMPGRFQLALSADASATPTVRFDMASTGFVTLSAYTSGRVPYFSTGGLLTNAATLTYDGASLVVSNTTSAVALNASNTVGVPLSLLGGSAATETVICHNPATASDNIFIKFYTEAGATLRGSITYNRGGGVVAYNTSSDYRAKDVYGAFTESGDVIDALQVHLGKMKGAIIERPMFIAHEAQAIVPYAVSGTKDAVDKDGKEILQQMDHSVLMPLVVAELKSLRGRLAAGNL